MAFLSLLAPACPFVPSLRATDSITKHWKNVTNINTFDLDIAAAYVRDADQERGQFGEARAIRTTSSKRIAYKLYSHWLSWWSFQINKKSA